jgi:transcription antitermination protein NusB
MSKKPSQRSDNRRAAMQYLYAWEYNRPEVLSDSIRAFFENETEERAYFSFAEQLIRGVIEHVESIDTEIGELAQNWSFDRIARVDLAILRLAIFELRYCEDIPPVVTINEAVELGKIFSKDDSKRFINGILDKIKNSLDRPARTATRKADSSSSGDDVLDGLI